MKLDPVILLEKLSKCSLSKEGVTRLPYTKEHRKALSLLEESMKQAGLKTHIDAAGTLIGRLEGKSSQTLLLGSHQDSVAKGGAYDGIMGIVLPICALSEIDKPLPFSVEVLAFADEEGIRFPTALIGSRALAGDFEPTLLQFEDKNGITIEAAMSDFGLCTEEILGIQRNPDDIIGFIETHIEQGPILESRNEGIGVVSAICGIERHQLKLKGEAAHAGTMPMEMRKDTLVVASEIIQSVHKIAQHEKQLMATVGELYVSPNTPNTVPGEVRMSLEIRSPDDEIRIQGRELILKNINEIISRWDIFMEHRFDYSQKATLCDSRLIKKQKEALSELLGKEAFSLPSGATHDASAMASLCPIAMFFIRCKAGISHNPKEFVTSDDLHMAVRALKIFLLKIDEKDTKFS